MYTRPYNDERHGIVIPDSYGGTALHDSITANDEDRGKNPWESQQQAQASTDENEESTEVFANEEKSQSSSFLSGIFKNTNFSLQKLGKEEILLLTAAAFLFFSKEGDKQLALMLLLLIFLG